MPPCLPKGTLPCSNKVDADKPAFTIHNTGGSALRGISDVGHGVHGAAKGKFAGVRGENTGSEAGNGVHGSSKSGHGVFAASSGDLAALRAEAGSGDAGHFVGAVRVDGALHVAGTSGNVHVDGDVTVNGDIFLPSGGDCAEEFEVAPGARAEPGTLMVVDADGALRASDAAYDRRVVGVISGAGELRPGIVLGRKPGGARVPIALVGRAYCKADAADGPIEVGDLLTTSATPGHAMKAADPGRAFGAVFGKALRPLAAGCGLIPVLIALQ
jgi:hypothetical protein